MVEHMTVGDAIFGSVLVVAYLAAMLVPLIILMKD